MEIPKSLIHNALMWIQGPLVLALVCLLAVQVKSYVLNRRLYKRYDALITDMIKLTDAFIGLTKSVNEAHEIYSDLFKTLFEKMERVKAIEDRRQAKKER